MAEIERQDTGLAAIRSVPLAAPFGWLKAGLADALAHPGPSLFYGVCFALMGAAIYVTLKHAYQYVSALVLAVILLVWARASLIVFALFYTSSMPTLDTFLAQVFSLENVEFLLAYACVGGFFAALVFAISVVAIPMMLDRNTDGIVAALTSLKACSTNPGPMLVWGALIVLLTAVGFALCFAGLAITVPIIGHASWHAYRALVEK